MATESLKLKLRDGALPALDVAIEAMNLAKEISCITPAKAVFGSASVLLGMIRDFMANEKDYVDIGLFCADACQALDRGLNGRQLDELSQSVRGAIGQLTTAVAEMQRNIVKQGKRSTISRVLRARSDKDAIAGWKQDFSRILQIFNTELLVNNHTILLDIRRNRLADQGGTDCQHQPTRVSIPLGELPPPQLGACFGREGLVETIVGLTENFNSFALIGTGGIGKTSVALAVLHCDRIKERFGDNRRFIRCDQFPPSRANFLDQLSKVIGAAIENPKDLTSLRPFLSSGEMFIVLDNAESILDPQGADGRDIYDVVEELSQFSNVCLAITSRITTVPQNCETLEIPTLSLEAACATFYRIYKSGNRSDSVNHILKQLDFHPLSIILLATVAHQNKWDNARLAEEWEQHRTGILHTEHNKSLAATVELSLASPMFKSLGPDARELLGVIAFFPQGVNENHSKWLFPTIPNPTAIFDKFCVLSLTYRSNGFVTMLMPLRDYHRPKDPLSSPLFLTTKERYFTRMSITLDRGAPRTKETQWITLEDLNVEYLLEVLSSIDASSDDVWSACINFIYHLSLHKQRQTVLGPRIEGLPDDHRSKPECLFWLGELLESVENYTEQKRLLSHALKLAKTRGNYSQVALALVSLSNVNWCQGLRKEGIHQAKDALGIFERIGDVEGQGRTLISLAWLLYSDKQLTAAEEAASRAIEVLPEKGQEFQVCRSHRVLGNIHRFKEEREKAIHHLETALRIASAFHWSGQVFWIHYSLAELFWDEEGYGDAHSHIERAKLHAANNAYHLGRALELQALVYHGQWRLKDATSAASCALEIFKKLGVAGDDQQRCEDLLQRVKQAKKSPWYTIRHIGKHP